MSKRQPRALKQYRNEVARLAAMGVIEMGIFPSQQAAIAAALGWGFAAHTAGRSLPELAAWVSSTNPKKVKVTLASRDYFRGLMKAKGSEPDAEAAFALKDPDNELRMFVVNGEEFSTVMITLGEMKVVHDG